MAEFESVGSEENVFRDEGEDVVVSAVVVVVVVVVPFTMFVSVLSFFLCRQLFLWGGRVAVGIGVFVVVVVGW